MYFWHPAFDNYPVVGITWQQAPGIQCLEDSTNEFMVKENRRIVCSKIPITY